jgi:hypothetical protein
LLSGACIAWVQSWAETVFFFRSLAYKDLTLDIIICKYKL